MKALRLIFALTIFTLIGQEAIAQCDGPKWGVDSVKTRQTVSLYEDACKKKDFSPTVVSQWRYVFTNAPGLRLTTHVCGVNIFNHFAAEAKKAKDEPKMRLMVDTIMIVYRQRIECFGDKNGGTHARMAIDRYKYLRKDQADIEINYQLFKDAIAIAELETPYYILTPYLTSAVKLYKAEKIELTELVNAYFKVNEIVEYGSAKNQKEIQENLYDIKFVDEEGNTQEEKGVKTGWSYMVEEAKSGLKMSIEVTNQAKNAFNVDVVLNDEVLENKAESGTKVTAKVEATLAADGTAEYRLTALDPYGLQRKKIFKLMKPYLKCEDVTPILQKQYDADPENAEVRIRIFQQLWDLRCAGEPLFKTIAEIEAEQNPSEKLYRILYKLALREKNTTEAMEYAKKCLELAETNERKAEYSWDITKMYRRKGDFVSARTWALKTAALRPNWGEPYMLIGDMYRGSGKKCGPGTGWESQVVTWPAIDKYEKAKAVDPSMTGRADRRIKDSMKYVPKEGDCFFRTLNNGDPYKVECWIQEQTKCRCQPE